MDIMSFLFHETVVERNLYNYYYVGMAIISFIAIFLAYRTRLLRFSLLLWAFSGLICLIWEASLFFSGIRDYNYIGIIELLYHALTEAGPGLIIMVITAEKIKMIDLERFRERW